MRVKQSWDRKRRKSQTQSMRIEDWHLTHRQCLQRQREIDAVVYLPDFHSDPSFNVIWMEFRLWLTHLYSASLGGLLKGAPNARTDKWSSKESEWWNAIERINLRLELGETGHSLLITNYFIRSETSYSASSTDLQVHRSALSPSQD